MLGHRGARVTLLEVSKSGAKSCGDGDLAAAAPEEESTFYGFQTQSAAAEITWPPRRDTPIRFSFGFSLYF